MNGGVGADGDRRIPSNEVVDENDISMLLGEEAAAQNGEKQRFFKVPFNSSGDYISDYISNEFIGR